MRLLDFLPVGLCLAQISAAAALPPPPNGPPSPPGPPGPPGPHPPHGPPGHSVCKNPPKRVEWRQLSAPQKKSYIKAVQCLTHKQAKSGIPGAINRYDDHQGVHMLQKPQIHWVGHFLLWHRYFVATYEKALRDECGYKGGQPYWDWSLDARPKDFNSMKPFDIDLFDPKTGFGGNGHRVVATPQQNRLNITGSTGGGCVKNGPFAPPNFMLHLPTTTGDHCLTRDFTPNLLNRFADPKLIDELMAQPDYTSVARTVEKEQNFIKLNVHASGHFGVGGILGTMGNAAESPGDPLFYFHHGNIDRIFWEWQQKDLKTRLNQVGGPIKPFDYSGQNVTLDFEINMGALAGNATLKDILNTEGGTLCYRY